MSKQPLISYERVEHEAPRVLVFRLSGKLHGSPRCFEFLEDVRDEVRDGRRSVVIDFAGLDMMNSTGVGIVAACYTSLKKAEGILAVSGVNDRIRTLFEIVCLWDLVRHHDTEDDAVAAFG